jgi:hypothetical protein
MVLGETDDYSYNIVSDPVHIHDLQATILRCLGIDHKRLTFQVPGATFQTHLMFTAKSCRRSSRNKQSAKTHSSQRRGSKMKGKGSKVSRRELLKSATLAGIGITGLSSSSIG